MRYNRANSVTAVLTHRVMFHVPESVVDSVLDRLDRYMMPGEWIDRNGGLLTWHTRQPSLIGGKFGVLAAVNNCVNGHPADHHPCSIVRVHNEVSRA